MKNKIKPQRFFTELKKLPNGKYKIVFADKLTQINQHKRKWVGSNARELARDINSAGLVIS